MPTGIKKNSILPIKNFIKVRSFSRLNIELIKKILNYKKYEKNFLTKTLVNWENEKNILNFKSYYNSL